MKKLSGKFLAAILLLVVITSYSWGQDNTDFSLNRNLILKSESQEQKITVAISEIYSSLKLSINAMIQEGELTIEIYDPNGEKQGNFSIGCQLGTPKINKNEIQSERVSDSGTKEMVQGRITRTIAKPLKGNWIVKIIPKSASGQVQISSDQKTAEEVKN